MQELPTEILKRSQYHPTEEDNQTQALLIQSQTKKSASQRKNPMNHNVISMWANLQSL